MILFTLTFLLFCPSIVLCTLYPYIKAHATSGFLTCLVYPKKLIGSAQYPYLVFRRQIKLRKPFPNEFSRSNNLLYVTVPYLWQNPCLPGPLPTMAETTSFWESAQCCLKCLCDTLPAIPFPLGIVLSSSDNSKVWLFQLGMNNYVEWNKIK